MTIHVSYLPDENGIRSIFNGFYNNQEAPENALEITEEQLDECMDILNVQQKLLWIDVNDVIQTRDKLSIWDVETQTFIPDQPAIDAQAKEQLISDASELLKNDSKYSMPFFNTKFTTQMNTDVTDYLDILYDIVFNPETLETALPTRPSFLP